MKTFLLILILSSIIFFNWNNMPSFVKDAVNKIKPVSSEIMKKGKDMPKPIEKYMNAVVIPYTKEIKKNIKNIF